MTAPLTTCPDCDGRMRITHTRPLDRLIERRRTCRDCGRRDLVRCEPPKIISVSCVPTHKTTASNRHQIVIIRVTRS